MQHKVAPLQPQLEEMLMFRVSDGKYKVCSSHSPLGGAINSIYILFSNLNKLQTVIARPTEPNLTLCRIICTSLILKSKTYVLP